MSISSRSVTAPVTASRRTVLRGGLTAAALGAAGAWSSGAVSASAAPGQAFAPYSADSFFRSRVIGAPVDQTATASFRRFMAAHPEQTYDYPLIRGVDGNQWGMPYATGFRRHPVWKLTGNVPKEVADLASTGFHAPDWFGDMLTGTSDSPFVVMDRASAMSVWAANARVVAPRTISVSAAGRFMHRSNGLDKRNPRSNDTRNFRSRGAIPDAMVIRRHVVDVSIQQGTGLGHVLHLFLVETDSSAGHCHPMIGSESGKYGWGAEGQRLAIDPRVDLTQRGLSPAGLVVARTLQEHGCYVGDNSGSSSGIKAQQASGRRDMWRGMLTQHSLAGITWDDFVVLPQGWQ